MQIGEWRYQKDEDEKAANREFSEKLRALFEEYYMPRVCEHGAWGECEGGCERADTTIDQEYLVGGVVAAVYYASLNPEKDGDLQWVSPEGQSKAVTYYLLARAAQDGTSSN